MTLRGRGAGPARVGYYVNHPELPLDKAVAMINMDMIGRMRDGKVYIGGVGHRLDTSTPMLEQVAAELST